MYLGQLSTIIIYFTSTNRTVPPAFDEVTSCFSKSLRAGIITECCGMYTVNEDWFRKIHFYDEIANNEIDSMLLFEESFVGIGLQVVNDSVRRTLRNSIKKMRNVCEKSILRLKSIGVGTDLASNA